jgi:large subunit ribosomal protein L17
MNHKNGFNPLSRTTAHRRAMSRNMVTSLFRFERITTTKSKALEVRKAAEKMITRSKVDTVHNRRIAAKFIQDEKILNKLFTEIGPRMKGRNGGYTRVLKIGFRQGDAADMVILELVDYKLPTEDEKVKAPAKEKDAAPKVEGSAGTSPAKKAEPKAAKTSKKPAADKKADTVKKAPAKASVSKSTTAKKAAPKAEDAANKEE